MRSTHSYNLAVERVQTVLFWTGALALGGALVAILSYLTVGAVGFLSHNDLFGVLFSARWAPTEGRYGMGLFFLGSAVVAGLALLLVVPLGLGLAVWGQANLQSSGRERLAVYLTALSAVPSVVWGWWGLTAVVPLLRTVGGGPGYSLMAGGLVVGVMLFPTFAQLALQALCEVPESWVEGSFALGASSDQTLLGIILPAASEGIRRALWIALARALGETIAVQMVVGGYSGRFWGVMAPGATVTSQLLTDLPLLPPGTVGHGALDLMALLLVVVMGLLTRWAGRRPGWR
jgi:phosphate transport system permease protein